MRRLAVDIGNTRVKIGIYDELDLIHFALSKRLNAAQILRFAKKFSVEKCVVCASGEFDQDNLSRLTSSMQVLVIHHEMKMPITLDYETPNTLGRDRIAAALGAWRWFRGLNSLVVNMGTCITMDLVTEKGVFMGGNISPGISMRLKAMHKFTASLPLLEIDLPESNIGKNTRQAMQNGAIRGAFYEVETFISKLSEKYPHLNVVLSGGDAPLFEKYTKNHIFARPNIVLDGLIEASIYNQ
jgi:type III pantothenate kinase